MEIVVDLYLICISKLECPGIQGIIEIWECWFWFFLRKPKQLEWWWQRGFWFCSMLILFLLRLKHPGIMGILGMLISFLFKKSKTPGIIVSDPFNRVWQSSTFYVVENEQVYKIANCLNRAIFESIKHLTLKYHFELYYSSSLYWWNLIHMRKFVMILYQLIIWWVI